MRFRVGRDVLGEAVSFVSRALASRPVVPLLSGMLMEASGDRLTLSCFDYEVSARVRIEAEVFEPGSALVPGRLLAEITRSLPGKPVEFSDEADVVNLMCGRAEFGLVCLPVDDYPQLPESPEPVGMLDGGALATAVAQVASSASRDDTLPMLTAVCLDISGQVMTLAATDRYRLAAREVTFAPVEPDVRALALVPARIMVEAARTLVPGVPVTLAFRTDGGETDRRDARGAGARATGAIAADQQPHPVEGLISLESRDRRLTARLIGGDFIRYRSRFPDEFSCRADLPAGPVIEAVRRAALVADRASPVRLSFRPDQVVIEAHAEGRARAAETVSADFAGDQHVISFNPHYLLDGLAAAAAGRPVAVPAGAGVAAGSAEPAGDGEPAGGGDSAGRADPAGGGDSAAGEDLAGGGDSAAREGAPGGAAATGGRPAAAADASAEAGRIRLEFNSPAKPALITWVPGDQPEPGTAGDKGSGTPPFRYLLVPLRVPERN